jgi:hypothetical protein
MKKHAARLAWKPGYEGDEIALGLSLAAILHVPAAFALYLAWKYPLPMGEDDRPVIAQPVIGATLLKLGKPLDPKKLPDRIIPQARTAPKQQVVASQEDPLKKTDKPDAGPPPPNTQESDIQKLISKSDPFAEDAGKARPEEGFANGSDAGTETDPSKVRAGDAYAALLGSYFHERWQYPTVISQGEANKLCVVMQVAISPRMQIWHVRQEPVKKSGNDLFDDSARSMLQKLLDDHASLPEPPPEVAESFRGRTVQIALSGDLHGDSSRCK